MKLKKITTWQLWKVGEISQCLWTDVESKV